MLLKIEREIKPEEIINPDVITDAISEEFENNLLDFGSSDVVDEWLQTDETYDIIVIECYKYMVDYLNDRIKTLEEERKK